jgi:hypothetical protein
VRGAGIVIYRVWRLGRKLGTCKWCHRPIVWVRTDDNRALPFNPHEKPLRQETHPRTQVVFDIFRGEASHLWSCKYKPKRQPSS